MYLILRPKAKLANSVKLFKEAGIEALGCAVIETKELPSARTLINDVIQCKPNIIIVTSTVAADILTNALNDKQGIIDKHRDIMLSTKPIFIGVGAASTKKLVALGLNALTAEPANSEGILALIHQLKLTSVNVAILKGKGGRKLISESLGALGFVISEFNVYERIVLKNPFFTDGVKTQNFKPENIRCIIATSTEIIDAAYNFFEPEWLNACRWLVVSQRTKLHLVGMGANNIIVSNGATDSHLIAAVHQVKGSHNE
jgi:uroporphyrinogen-III synthase